MNLLKKLEEIKPNAPPTERWVNTRQKEMEQKYEKEANRILKTALKEEFKPTKPTWHLVSMKKSN